MIMVQEEGNSRDSRGPMEAKRSGVMAGISGVSLELVCHYRLHGNVETMAVLPAAGVVGSGKRDSIILTFQDAKISVLEFEDSIHGLRTRLRILFSLVIFTKAYTFLVGRKGRST